jgi:hypothetical protein
MHLVASISHQDCTLLNVKDLACFYFECMDDNSKFYETQIHVKPWKLLRLELFNVSSVNRLKLHLILNLFTCLACWSTLGHAPI